MERDTYVTGFRNMMERDTIMIITRRGVNMKSSVFRLLRKSAKSEEAYDLLRFTPVVRVGICTGEKTAGFLDSDTGKFREVMLIRTPEDLEEFRQQYGIKGEIKTIY